jgi:uncharacterized surface protein with fasciclin (FAS1) repeats
MATLGAALREIEALSRFTYAVEVAGMADLLEDAGPFTVFAPDDAAFAKLPADLAEALFHDPPRLEALLNEHISLDVLVAADLMLVPAVVMRSGLPFPVATDAGIRIGPAYMTLADIEADNGVLHMLDGVLLREE